MPVFKSGKGLAPEWCEMEYFDIVKLAPGEKHSFERVGKKEKLIVGRGKCRIAFGDQVVDAEPGAQLDIEAPGDHYEVSDVQEDTTLVRMCGRWGDEVGGSGIFWLPIVEDPKENGDPVDYAKNHGLDNHYHDCDEYWIFYEGRGVAVTEGKFFDIGPGDCVATGMGQYHDMALVTEPTVGVFFETTMEGRKRPGHLWAHTHGAPETMKERV
jgi:mannose-6-phosphate isomerase-like protein (cupin superfamily)